MARWINGLALASFALTLEFARAEGPAAFEEVIVTARKRAEIAQSVPIAITTFSGADLTYFAARSLEDLRQLVPSLAIAPTTFRQDTLNISLRGQRNFDNPGLSFDTAVAVYKDGVYLARPIGLDAALFDVEAVEVLNGPQGTLIGRNSTGGAITYRSHAPEAIREAHLALDYGSLGRSETQGMINLPLSDHLFLRIAGVNRDFPGYIRNLYRDPQSGAATTTAAFGTRQIAGQASLKWQVSDRLSLLLRAELSAVYDTGSTYHDLGYFVGSAPASGGKPSICNIPATCTGFTDLAGRQIAPFYDNGVIGTLNPDPRAYNAVLASRARAAGAGFWTAEQAIPNYDQGHYHTLAATIDQAFASWSLHGLIATRGWDNQGQAISRGLPYATNIFGYDYPAYRAYQGEVTATGDLGAGRIQWTTGLFVFHEQSPRDGGYLWLFLPAGGFPQAVSGKQLTVTDSSRNGEANDSLAGFAQASADLADDTRLTLGARMTRDDRFAHLATQTIRTPSNPALASGVRNGVYSADPYSLYGIAYAGRTMACALTDPTGTLLPLGDCSIDIRRGFRRPTFTLALDRDLAPGVLTYLTARSGYRAGAINSGAINPAVTVARPEDVRDLEWGLKAQDPEARWPWRVNLAAYVSDYRNLQIQTTLPNITLATAPGGGGCTQAIYNAGQCLGTSNDNVTLNARAARILGAELWLTLSPLDRLTLSAGGSYLDAVYTDYSFAPPGGYLLPAGATNLSGTPIPLPRWQGNLRLAYDLTPVGAPIGHWSGALTLYGQSRPRADLRAFDASQRAGGYGLLGARVEGRDLFGSDTSLALYATNLTNERVCGAEYNGVLNSAPNATFGIPNTSGLLQCVPLAPRLVGVRVERAF